MSAMAPHHFPWHKEIPANAIRGAKSDDDDV